MVDLHDAGEDEALDVGAEAADVSGELEGQHGDSPVGEIDAGATETGFLIEP